MGNFEDPEIKLIEAVFKDDC